MKKFFSLALVAFLTSINLALIAVPVAAQEPEADETPERQIEREIINPPTTLIPRISNPNIVGSNHICTVVIKRFEEIYFFELDGVGDQGSIDRFINAVIKINEESLGQKLETIGSNDILGCAMLTGRVKLAYLRIYMFYALRLLTVISGTISMLFILIGGYKYIISAITENKDEGKRTIIYAIVGLIVSTLAWVIVNVVQTFVTS